MIRKRLLLKLFVWYQHKTVVNRALRVELYISHFNDFYEDLLLYSLYDDLGLDAQEHKKNV